MNTILSQLLVERGIGTGTVDEIKWTDQNLSAATWAVQSAYQEALNRCGSAMALLLTSTGIPMMLAGEEFADIHDLDYKDWRLKMSDPVDWKRRDSPGHKGLLARVSELIRLRTSHEALQRNETEFFYFHPTIDDPRGTNVFAYCRTANKPLGSAGQVAVVANLGADDFPVFELEWPWDGTPREVGMASSGVGVTAAVNAKRIRASLAPFQVRVFSV